MARAEVAVARPGPARGLALAALAALSALGAGCEGPSCLRGECRTPCPAVAFACDLTEVTVGRVADLGPGAIPTGGQGGAGDLVLRNAQVHAVIAALDAPGDLATTGGYIIDLAPTGGRDDVTAIYQLAGILPEDTFSYRTVELTQEPERAAITVRGSLDGWPEVEVVTHYELGPCDPGVRMRSELWNGSRDPIALTVADGAHWGNRRVAPYAPLPGEGYLHPELDLLELTALWNEADYAAGAAAAPGAPAYGIVACSAARLAGVHDLEVSATGTALEVVRPGQSVVFERLLVAAGGVAIDRATGPAAATDVLLGAQAQLRGQPTPRLVSGRIEAGCLGFGGDSRRASIAVDAGAGTTATPLTAVVPAADGTFTVSAPSDRPLTLTVWSFGRPVATVPVPINTVDVGVIPVPAPALAQLRVDRTAEVGPPSPTEALVVLHPADEATRAAVTGTFHGLWQACAPWLGPPHGASPACNRVLVDPAGTDVEVPAGRYQVFATIGPAGSLARTEVTLIAGETTPITLTVSPLALTPPGWISADLHVHGQASFDASIPDDDRVRSFVAAGVEVIAATDHDAIADYADAVARLGVADRVTVLGGLETTPLLPFLDVPGADLPRVIGHFNFWPLTPVPSAPRGGAPWDERLEPGALFDRMAPLLPEHGVRMLNHPWAAPQTGRDLGYLRAIEFDPCAPIPEDPGDLTASNNALLQRRPGGGARNGDWDVIEILNNAGVDEWARARPLWFALLSQGFAAPGAGNSDSHGLSDAQLGWARTWVALDRPVGQPLDVAAFDRALKDGQIVAGTGVFVHVRVGPPAGATRGPGRTPYVPASGDVLIVDVYAPPWVPVTEVRLATSRGTRVIASGADLTSPADPFAPTAATLRYHGELALADQIDRDDWIVVEAGLPAPLMGDLDGDHVVDTSDNNGDGVVDRRDVELGEDVGPLHTPPDPIDPADPRWPMTRVVPLGYPIGVASPIFIDRAGDGWQAPGLAGC